MKSSTNKSVKNGLKVAVVVLGVAALGVLGYRYYNRPSQTWNADAFEGRNPDKVATKGQGQQYWQATGNGQGFYITDASTEVGQTKKYCVSGGVGSSEASYSFNGQTLSSKNGFFTKCVDVTLNDKRQISFSVTSGELQVYRVDRKR